MAIEVVLGTLMLVNLLAVSVGVFLMLNGINDLHSFAETQLSRRRVVKKKEVK